MFPREDWMPAALWAALKMLWTALRKGADKHGVKGVTSRTPAYHVTRALRHLDRDSEKEIDPDTGMWHLVSAACRLVIAIAARLYRLHQRRVDAG